MTTLTLATACTLKVDGDSDPSTGATDAGTVSAGETGAPSTDSATDPGPTTTATDPGPTDPGATDTGFDETTTATDGAISDTDTGGGETGQAFPGDCVEVDASVSAAFALDLAGWPVDPEGHTFKVTCTVGAVTAGADAVDSELACELDGMQLAAILSVAAAPEGAVAWGTGDVVTLSSRTGSEGSENAFWRSVQLRGADDALLMSGDESNLSDAVYSQFKPLGLALVAVCAENPEMFNSKPMRVDFEPLDGPVVSIFHGHRGVVPIDADATFAIDVERAIGGDVHPDEDIKILLRRVATGG